MAYNIKFFIEVLNFLVSKGAKNIHIDRTTSIEITNPAMVVTFKYSGFGITPRMNGVAGKYDYKEDISTFTDSYTELVNKVKDLKKSRAKRADKRGPITIQLIDTLTTLYGEATKVYISDRGGIYGETLPTYAPNDTGTGLRWDITDSKIDYIYYMAKIDKWHISSKNYGGSFILINNMLRVALSTDKDFLTSLAAPIELVKYIKSIRKLVERKRKEYNTVIDILKQAGAVCGQYARTSWATVSRTPNIKIEPSTTCLAFKGTKEHYNIYLCSTTFKISASAFSRYSSTTKTRDALAFLKEFNELVPELEQLLITNSRKKE